MTTHKTICSCLVNRFTRQTLASIAPNFNGDIRYSHALPETKVLGPNNPSKGTCSPAFCIGRRKRQDIAVQKSPPNTSAERGFSGVGFTCTIIRQWNLRILCRFVHILSTSGQPLISGLGSHIFQTTNTRHCGYLSQSARSSNGDRLHRDDIHQFSLKYDHLLDGLALDEWFYLLRGQGCVLQIC
jgi:hypothetical protein